MGKKRKEEFDSERAAKLPASEVAEYLTPREILFVKEYLKTLNGTQAAIQANYKAGENNASAAVQASRLLRDPRIRTYRDALLRESVEDMSLTSNNVLLRLMEIYQRCMAAVPVMIWDGEKREWVESGVWKFDAKGATKALEQIAKIMGMEVSRRFDPKGGGVEELMAQLDGGREY